MNSWLQSIFLLLLGVVLTPALPTRTIIPPEGETFEGDIIVSHSLTDYIKGTTSKKREYHSSTFLWKKDGNFVKIPYTISGLDTQAEKNVKQAFHAFKGQTCIDFVPRKGQTDYIEFETGDNGCSSSIGRQGGRQSVFLDSGCTSVPTILHEIMHAIGFLHEQSREDRDDYVLVKYDNIDGNYQNQFLTYSIQSLGYPYDKKSLMHYKKNDFSKNGQPTIESKSDPNELLGNDDYFTKTDVKQINTLYNCPSRFTKLDDYAITIYTSNEWWAGTGATVYLQIQGLGLDSSGEFKAGTGFDADSNQKIEMFFPHMDVKKLSVRHDNQGWGPAWHLKKIVIKDKTIAKVLTFECNCWIEGVKAKSLT